MIGCGVYIFFLQLNIINRTGSCFPHYSTESYGVVLWKPTRRRKRAADCKNMAKQQVATDSLTMDKRGALELSADKNGACEARSARQEAEQTLII